MTLKLEAKKRETTGKKASFLRPSNLISAVVYGHGFDNVNLELDYNTFEKAFQEAGESTLIDLAIDGQTPIKTLIAEVQHDPVKNRITHIDFHQVRMDEKINANVQLKFVGESNAVKADGGVLVHSISELETRCLPSDLIHEIEVDISVLNTFDDVIAIKDLKLSAQVEIIGHEPEDVVALVARPRTDAEMAALETPAEAPVVPAEEVAPAEGEEKKAE